MASGGTFAQQQQQIINSNSNHSSFPNTNELRSPLSSSAELVQSELSVLSLVLVDAPTRHDIGALLQCRATNIDAQKPIIRVMKLDVNCKHNRNNLIFYITSNYNRNLVDIIFSFSQTVRPTKAVIVDMNSENSMVAGSTVFVTCLSWGSRPAAKIRWLLRDRPLLDVK